MTTADKEQIISVFQELQAKCHSATNEDLSLIYDNAVKLGAKYAAAGQSRALQKLIFTLDTIEKERQIIALGINKFLYKEDIEEYVEEFSTEARPIKVIEIEHYEREIPDEIVEVVEKVKGIFDQLYIIFTDYTGRTERRIAAEERADDPILFGVFKDEGKRVCVNRFYYLGDWEDEFCNLTLDRLLQETKVNKGRDILHHTYTPKTPEELRTMINGYRAVNGNSTSINMAAENNRPEWKLDNEPQPRPFLTRIKSFFTRK